MTYLNWTMLFCFLALSSIAIAFFLEPFHVWAITTFMGVFLGFGSPISWGKVCAFVSVPLVGAVSIAMVRTGKMRNPELVALSAMPLIAFAMFVCVNPVLIAVSALLSASLVAWLYKSRNYPTPGSSGVLVLGSG